MHRGAADVRPVRKLLAPDGRGLLAATLSSSSMRWSRSSSARTVSCSARSPS